MAETKTVQIIIEAQAKVDQATKEVKTKLEGMKSSVENMQPAFQKMAAIGTVAFTALAGIAVTSIKAFQEAERSTRQLEHAILDISKGTRKQVEEIDALSKSLQKKVGIDGDALKAGAAQLSTFGLQAKSVVALTKSLADLTVNQNGINASSDQYITSANVIAKALNGQFGILEKSGIRFTEAQKKTIEFGKESEKVGAIIAGLNQNLRETTDTLAGTGEASIARATRAFGELQESVGKALVPALETLMAKLTPLLDKFGEWAEKNPDLLAKIILIGGAVLALVAGLGFLGMALPGIITLFGGMATAVKFLTTGAFGPWITVLLATAAAIIAINDSIKKFQALTASMRTDVQDQKGIQSNTQKLIDQKKAKGEDTSRLESALAQSQFATSESERYLDSSFLGKVFFKQKSAPSAPQNLSDTMLTADEANTRAAVYNVTFNGDITDKNEFLKKLKDNMSQVLSTRQAMP